jgi:hypothetical protein
LLNFVGACSGANSQSLNPKEPKIDRLKFALGLARSSAGPPTPDNLREQRKIVQGRVAPASGAALSVEGVQRRRSAAADAPRLRRIRVCVIVRQLRRMQEGNEAAAIRCVAATVAAVVPAASSEFLRSLRRCKLVSVVVLLRGRTISPGSLGYGGRVRLRRHAPSVGPPPLTNSAFNVLLAEISNGCVHIMHPAPQNNIRCGCSATSCKRLQVMELEVSAGLTAHSIDGDKGTLVRIARRYLSTNGAGDVARMRRILHRNGR